MMAFQAELGHPALPYDPIPHTSRQLGRTCTHVRHRQWQRTALHPAWCTAGAHGCGYNGLMAATGRPWPPAAASRRPSAGSRQLLLSETAAQGTIHALCWCWCALPVSGGGGGSALPWRQAVCGAQCGVQPVQEARQARTHPVMALPPGRPQLGHCGWHWVAPCSVGLERAGLGRGPCGLQETAGDGGLEGS